MVIKSNFFKYLKKRRLSHNIKKQRLFAAAEWSSKMEKRKLGKTGKDISALSFGCMEMQHLDKQHAGKLLNKALDLGINYFDTSPEYANSEYFIGESIANRRDEFTLATKCCDNMTGIGELFVFDRKTCLSNLEESLRRLKTDHIDVWQIHGAIPKYVPDGEFGEVMETMREAKKAGKVLHLGLTIRQGQPVEYGFPATYAYDNLPTYSGWSDIEVIQCVYGGMTRLAENVIQQAYDKYQTGIIARGVVKKYDAMYDVRFEASKLSELFEEGETRNQFLIRYALTHPGLASMVVGTKNINHLIENVDIVKKGKLSAEIYAEAKKRLNFVGIVAGPLE
jgi:aryl-alcohol dehydrogenase-like predicted oxidoreductase